MDILFSNHVFELIFNKQIDINTRYFVARDSVFIISRLRQMSESGLAIRFDKNKLDFLHEVCSAVLDGKNILTAASQLFMMDKYIPYKSVIKEIRKESYDNEKIEYLCDQVEQYKRLTYIGNNMSKVEKLVERFKDDDFKSPQELEEEYKSAIEGVYIEMLENMQSWSVNSNCLYLYKNRDKRELLRDRLKRFYARENLLPCEYYALDRSLGEGFEPTRLIMFAAKPGAGKSAMLLNLSLAFAKNLKKNKMDDKKFILYITLENSLDETIGRLGANILDIPYYNIRSVYNDNSMRDTANRFFDYLEDLPIFIQDFDSHSITPSDIINQLNSITGQYNQQPAAICIDYLDLINWHENIETRLQLGKIASALKNIAKKYKIPVITATQLNKAGYEKENNDLSDVTESGKKVDFSDVVIMMKKLPGTVQGEDSIKLTIAKNRCGPPGSFNLRYIGEKFRFCNPINNDPKAVENQIDINNLDSYNISRLDSHGIINDQEIGEDLEI